MTETIQKQAEFVVDTKFEDLPEAVAHAAKFLLLDSIGWGLASVPTDREK